MRIGFIGDCLLNQKTGIGMYAQGIVDAMRSYATENTYTLILPYPSPTLPSPQSIVKNPLPFGKKIIWYNYLPYKINGKQFDMVFNLYSIPHAVPFSPKEIVVVHDLSVVYFPKFHTKRTYVLYTLLYKKTVEKAYRIVANSNATKQALIETYHIPPEKIFVLYIPLETTNQISRFAVKKPYILNINTIEPRKNIPGLVKAFEYLKKTKHIPHQLVIAGKRGWKYQESIRRIKQSPVSSDIMMAGYVSGPEKKYLYKNASVFVYPSFYEGLGIPVFEALEQGCPTVCGSIPITTEYLKKCAQIINPYNPQSIADGIYQVLYSPGRKQQLLKTAKHQIKNLQSTSYARDKIHELMEFLT